jgi:hypothetical protein
MRASSAERALATLSRRALVAAVSTLAHGSAAWGSAAILAGLPSISGRGGDVALEGSSAVEVVLLSLLGSGAVPKLGGAAFLAGGASGVVLATAGAAGAAPVTSGKQINSIGS